MTDRLKAAAAGALIAILPANAGAQTLLETYRAEIAPVDRRNSAGAALTDPGAILAQDRANVHRFGHRQAGDTMDATFSSRSHRAAMNRFLSRGSVSPAASQVLRSGGALLEVGIWGRAGSVSHITVDVAQDMAPQGGDPGDMLLPPADIAENAAGIQAALNARGFDAGPVDGQPGRQTRDAILAFQRSLGHRATGALTRSEWETLTALARAPGPSFDCTQAGTATERAICVNPALAALDRALGDAWTARRRVDNSEASLSEQRRWIAERDSCQGDMTCLQASMSERVAVLGGEVPDLPAMPTATTDIPVHHSENEATMTVAAQGGLVTVDGRILYSDDHLGALVVPQQSSISYSDHKQELERRLTYTEWVVGSENLEAGLAKGETALQRYFDQIPRAAQDEIVRLALSASGVSDITNDPCFKNARSSRYGCAMRNLTTEFDRRRFQQAAARIITRTAMAEQLDLPLRARAFCALGPIDRAFDFDTGMVDWASMIANSCQFNTAETDLASAVPQQSKMDPARVEDLARRRNGRDARGQPRQMPLMLVFDVELSLKQHPNGRVGPDGVMQTIRTLRRTGPVELRWSGAPEKLVLQFEAPTGNRPSEAVDLRQAGPAFRLLERAPKLDATDLGAVLTTHASSSDGIMVRLPAWATRQEPARLSIANFFRSESVAQQIAALTAQPLEHVAWTQLSSRERGVPDIELVLVFPTPFALVESAAIDPALAQPRNGEDLALLARISEPMLMEGSVGPALVAVVQPVAFEITEPGIGGARQVVARPELAEVEVDPRERVFLPTIWWFAAKAAELQGQDIDKYLNAAMDRANLHRGDTFARLDALDAARTKVQQARQAKEEAPWIAGRMTLGAYDLEGKAWPVNGVQLVLPVQGSTENALMRRVQPRIDVRALTIPMSIEEARAFEAAREAARRGAGPLSFYARVDMLAPQGADQLAAQAHIRELLLFVPQGSASQKMKVSPALDRDAAIARLEFDPVPEVEAMDSKPARTAAAAPVSTRTAASQAALAASSISPTATAPLPHDGWPELPELAVAQSDWDLLGLRTGMTLPVADAALRERGGILAVVERPRSELAPDQVRSTLYQRMYVGAEGTEAITLAAPGPEGPVLAVLRRFQLPRGDLPFDAILQSLTEKYGAPTMQDDLPEGARMYWFDGAPGAAQVICRPHVSRRVDVSKWRSLGDADISFDLSQRPAAWNWAIADMPVDYAEQASSCGHVLAFEPESMAQQGGAAFTMMLIDYQALRTVDETLANVPAAQQLKIDF